MQIVQVQIGETFPIILGCLPDATVALLKPTGIKFGPIVDRPSDHAGVGGYFSEQDVELFRSGGWAQTLNYNTAYRYKEIPLLLDWLKQQSLVSPL